MTNVLIALAIFLLIAHKFGDSDADSNNHIEMENDRRAFERRGCVGLGRFCGKNGKCCSAPWVCSRKPGEGQLRCGKKVRKGRYFDDEELQSSAGAAMLQRDQQQQQQQQLRQELQQQREQQQQQQQQELLRLFRRGSTRCKSRVALGRFCGGTACCRPPMECRKTPHGPKERCAKKKASQNENKFWGGLANSLMAS